MVEKHCFIATSTFGLEAVVKREIIKLGYQDISVLDGRVEFEAGIEAIPTANIWLRSSDRLLLNMGEFEARSFDELFEKTKALPWETWITKDGKFTVTGKSVRSKLYSVPDCQAIVKKAIVEKLKLRYKCEWFAETGPEYEVQVAILKDKVTLTIDTTGHGLHKRGYRENSVGVAPLKETLASALVGLSFWRKDRILLDPVCGSGTILIEAAMMARNIAPGLSRHFVSEQWPQIDKKIWKDVRAHAYASIDTDSDLLIYGSDMDEKSIELSKYNARKAGVDDSIRFEVKKFKDIVLPAEYGCCICNPPYGERLGSLKEVEELYKDMGRVFKNDNTWSVYVITSHEGFEKLYGKKADLKRKLFNGMIKTDYYQFLGPKPSKS